MVHALEEKDAHTDMTRTREENEEEDRLVVVKNAKGLPLVPKFQEDLHLLGSTRMSQPVSFI